MDTYSDLGLKQGYGQLLQLKAATYLDPSHDPTKEHQILKQSYYKVNRNEDHHPKLRKNCSSTISTLRHEDFINSWSSLLG